MNTPPTIPQLPTKANEPEPSIFAALARRYKDAYRVARFAIRLGEIVKIAGFIVAGVLALGGALPLLGAFAQAAQAKQIGAGVLLSFMWAAGALIFAALIGGFVFVLGILVSAQGQTLLASLDAAVNGSPSLNEDEKLAVMGVQTR